MHGESVERSSKWSHNFLNIQLIFNLKKVLESWDLGLNIQSYEQKCYEPL